MNHPIDISNTVIQTPRLTLRPWKYEDLEDFYAYARVDGVGQMAGWMPHRNIEESRAILSMFIEEKKTFALEYHAKVIGSLGIEFYDEKALPEYDALRGREIGYVLSKDYWGQGLMTEAVRAVINYLFEQVGLDFIVCGHFTDNIASRRVQEKCGFVHKKLIQSETRYGAVRDTWLSILRR